MRVAIVGGGIGGMALALSLVDAGIEDVEIYESASTLQELGVGITASWSKRTAAPANG
jgi:5-methylphenazine-1-carboxylate 1-monooxygenase